MDLNEENKVLKTEVIQLKNEVDHLKWLVKKFQGKIYGTSSEKFIDNSEQLPFNDIEAAADQEEPESDQILPDRPPNTGRKKRKPFPGNLPREEIIIDLDKKDKFCPNDGSKLKFIGYEITEKLKTVPAQVSVIEEKKAKYACPCCEGYMDQGKSNSILPKTIATPELLSFIIFSKFFQSLPLYRLEEFFKLQGIDISRGRMGHWLVSVSKKLMPLYNILEERAFATGYMAIDATRVQVLKEKGREPQTKSAMWVRGSPEKGIILFDYNTSEGGAAAKKLMLGFKGALQADAHGAYDALERESIDLLGCMMHSRRRFYESWVKSGKKAGLAKDALRKFKKLYKLEEAYRDQKLSTEQRFEARLKEVKPFLDKMKDWMTLQRQKVLPSHPLADGFNYFINHYEELSGFLTNGRYEIDNGWVERMIRKFAIGRNNWLFCDTPAGADTSALLYSLVITAKLNNKDPFKVMTEIFRQLSVAESIDDYEKLADLLTQ